MVNVLQDHDGGADLQVIHQDIQDVVAMQVLQDMEASVSSDLQVSAIIDSWIGS